MRMPQPLSVVGRLLLGNSPAGRAAAMLSTATAGVSFTPGLMPRSRRDQVLLTGVAAALQHGLVMNAQARHQIVANLICAWTGHADDTVGRQRVEAAVAAGTTAVGLVTYMSLPYHPREPFPRALARTAGIRLYRVGAASLVVDAADALDQHYGARSALVRVVTPAAGLLAGAGISAGLIRRFRRPDPVVARFAEVSVDPLTGHRLRPEPKKEGTATSVPVSLALGLGVAAALNLVSGVEGVVSGWVATGVRRLLPGSDPYAAPIGHTVVMSGFLSALGAGMEYLYHHAEAGGSAIDAAYTHAPSSPTVSGGPGSRIDWHTLGREGVRFVAMSLTEEEIATVTETPATEVTSPARCFAGLATASSVGARVGMVMEDLERFGAFERSVICLTSPTGTGYLNYVAVETLEYLTRGDCATVGIQYSLRPSFLSLDRVAMAREQNLALLNALIYRIRGLPEGERPRLVCFGESLGAQTLQNCFVHEGVTGFHRAGVDAALFLGTPAASRWASDWRADRERLDPRGEIVEVGGLDDWRAVEAKRSDPPRYVLLSNPEDPITKFSARIAVVRPDWLPRGPDKPPGVPTSAFWMPYTTMLVTVLDVVNALDFVPGVFVARGHDYRASIPRMVSEVFRLPASDEEMTRIEHALRNRERQWAEKRIVAEEMARASEAVSRQLRTWGEVSSTPLTQSATTSGVPA